MRNISCTYPLDDWVIGCSGIIFYAIDKLKWSLGFGRDTVIRFVIGRYSSVCVTFGREDSITVEEMYDSSLTCFLPRQPLI